MQAHDYSTRTCSKLCSNFYEGSKPDSCKTYHKLQHSCMYRRLKTFLLRWLLLLGHPVAADDAGVVALEGLQGHLLRRLELLQLQLLHLAGKHCLRRLRAVDAVRLGLKKKITVIIRATMQATSSSFCHPRHLLLPSGRPIYFSEIVFSSFEK